MKPFTFVAGVMRPYNDYPVAILNAHGAEIGRTDFMKPIPCTVSPACGWCWYCLQVRR